MLLLSALSDTDNQFDLLWNTQQMLEVRKRKYFQLISVKEGACYTREKTSWRRI